MKNYSQNNEQAVILDYFKDYKGTFIDIGANDGVTLSNTRALAELGWCGVFVEPHPMAFAKLKQVYPETKQCHYCYNVAIGTENNKAATLHASGSLMTSDDIGLVSSIIPDEVSRFIKATTFEDIPVQMFRWKTFINRLSIKTFDFVSIDIEGLEYEVLQQMDLSDVKLVCVETNGNAEREEKITALLSRAGLDKIIYRSPENLIYAR